MQNGEERMLNGLGPLPMRAAPPPDVPAPSARNLGALTFWTRDSRQLDQPLPAEIARANSDDEVKLVLHLSGEAQLEGGGRVEPLVPGTWGIYAFAKTCKIRGPYTQLIVSIPKYILVSRNPNLASVMKRQFPVETPAVALAFRFFTSLYESASVRAPFEHELADVGIQLLQVALAEQQAQLGGRTRREKFRSRIMSFVDMHLHDPNLTVEGIARANHCSSRYLQKMFGDPESVGRYLWRMRLERCRDALADPSNAELSITEIAFSLGFSNPSHFSRAFRERFATSPREYRAAMLKESLARRPLRQSASREPGSPWSPRGFA
jgi:AraC-like DNA-binding protein